MANQEHLAILQQGVEAWNQWRRGNGDRNGVDLLWKDIFGVGLREADLSRADLRGIDLRGADFRAANLRGVHLSGVDLTGARFMEADLSRADLSGTDLSGTDLWGVNLWKADLSRANLNRVNLALANLVGTNFAEAKLTGCQVYGISAWDVTLVGAQQSDLIITTDNEPVITVDNLEVAQFISLLLRNEKIRDVIETANSKVVLILGRFTCERKAVLDALREALRVRDRLPIVFDFTGPGSQTTDETISTLAHMARFVIADLTDAKSILQELRAIVPNSPSVLVQPILLASQEEPGMFDFFRRFTSVLEPYRYHSQEEVLASLDAQIIAPVEARYGR
jgi:uncharacterized protein YjbI with pentapeptide repeats